MITYDKFIKNHNGKAVDYDGTAWVQCVDLIKCYLNEVFGIKPGAWGDAHDYYDNFSARPQLVENFTRIANTPDFVPQKGDICVWKSSLSSGGWGHVSIATGEGDTTYFYSYDQNWTGNHDKCTKIKHDYNHFAGVLRPKDQSRITAETKSVSELATEVIQGKWGNGNDRKEKLEAAGYDYSAVQAAVHKLLGSGSSGKKSNDAIATEVIQGKWGNGSQRKEKLEAAGYDYEAVQKIVNQKLK